MNNLHRELAPISSAAWSQIEDEVARTFRRSVAGRRVLIPVDFAAEPGDFLRGPNRNHRMDLNA